MDIKKYQINSCLHLCLPYVSYAPGADTYDKLSPSSILTRQNIMI